MSEPSGAKVETPTQEKAKDEGPTIAQIMHAKVVLDEMGDTIPARYHDLILEQIDRIEEYHWKTVLWKRVREECRE